MKVAVAGLVLCVGSAAALADVVTDWNQELLNSISATNMAPPIAARAMAMVHTAQYEAVNSVTRSGNAYRQFLPCPTGTNTTAAAAASAHHVMSSLFPTRTAVFDGLLNSQLASIPNSPSKTDGIVLGMQSGMAMQALRASDNSNLNMTYSGGNTPGQWRPTGPAFQNAALPHWRYVTPFGVTSAQQFMAPPPPQINSAAYAAAYNEVRELGSATSSTRTAYQTDTAFLWRAGSNTVTPPGQWNQIAQQVSANAGLSLEQNARMFALLGIAVCDAGITAWEGKNTYNYWRPETGIQLAGPDGTNPAGADPAWTPLFTTPNHQSYVSGHSTFSSAAAAILRNAIGTDSAMFTVTGDGRTRMYMSFTDAMNDAGMSRIYGGIHWQFDNTAGLASGTSVGNFVFANAFQVVPAPGALALLGLGGLAIARRRR
jgi:hypothetical protein